ncbi:hypothetical protein TWF506_008249 [Arthrobotrys conoides]|uniref:Uncharacterized protein n=1 Tax=Arthrobotrys conoides TaxID=74498 RepID=A0AAN8RMJ7_9PEZI
MQWVSKIEIPRLTFELTVVLPNLVITQQIYNTTQHARLHQIKSRSTTSTNYATSTSPTSTAHTKPEPLQAYASDVVSSVCKVKITYTGLISTSLFYVSQGTDTSTTDVGERSTIFDPASSTITQTQTRTTVPVTATIVAKTIPQPTPMAMCRIGVGSNICWEIKYTQMANSSTDPMKIWISDTSREFITKIPLFTLDEYSQLTQTDPTLCCSTKRKSCGRSRLNICHLTIQNRQ